MRKLMLVLCSVAGIGIFLIFIAYCVFQSIYDVPVSRIDVLASDVKKLTEMLENYKELHGDYPSDIEGLSLLDIEGIPHRGYLPTIYTDPWGRKYEYRYPGIIIIQPIEVNVRFR